jgi:hypothetical protein
MASYAMVYAGAPLFFWRWAIQAAVFVSNITATYYSREQVWSTPYTLVYVEPFPDASIVVPFGCGALVLLDKADRAKFLTRCALLLFIHYATSHPLYTYAFYSPRTKRVLYRQDAIFLVNTFPMRNARVTTGLSGDGKSLVAVRSSLASTSSDHDSEFSFANWRAGDLLPDYVDHATGVPLVDDPNFTRCDTPALPSDWPCRCPHHPSFGPHSTVPVPVSPRFPSFSTLPSSPPESPIPLAPEGAPPSHADGGCDGMDSVSGVDLEAAGDDDDNFDADGDGDSAVGVADDLNTVCVDLDADAKSLGSDPLAYTTSAKDRDQSRGMGNYLRAPHAVHSHDAKRTRLNATALERSPVVTDSVLSPSPSDSPTTVPADSVPLVRRSTRVRRP